MPSPVFSVIRLNLTRNETNIGKYGFTVFIVFNSPSLLRCRPRALKLKLMMMMVMVAMKAGPLCVWCFKGTALYVSCAQEAPQAAGPHYGADTCFSLGSAAAAAALPCVPPREVQRRPL